MTTSTTSSENLLLAFDERPWAAYAACRDADPDLFFPEADGTPDAALRVCRGCPVLSECRDWALTTRVKYGVWGAMTEKDRRRVLRRTA